MLPDLIGWFSFTAPPTPPRNLRVTEVYKDFISLAWDTPEADGGEPIRGYNIEKSLGGGMFVSVAQVPADELEYKVCKLYEGSEYLFRVSAQNKIGTSNPTVLEKPVKAKLPFGKVTRVLRIRANMKDPVSLVLASLFSISLFGLKAESVRNISVI